MSVTDADWMAADLLAHQICGCADARQHRADVKALTEYREQAHTEGHAAGYEAAVRDVVAWLRDQPKSFVSDGYLIWNTPEVLAPRIEREFKP